MASSQAPVGSTCSLRTSAGGGSQLMLDKNHTHFFLVDGEAEAEASCTRGRFEDLIRSLHRPSPDGRPAACSAYVVVTHQHSTIRRAVDRLVFLHAGAVVWEGTVAEFDSSTVPIVAQFREGALDGPIKYE